LSYTESDPPVLYPVLSCPNITYIGLLDLGFFRICHVFDLFYVMRVCIRVCVCVLSCSALFDFARWRQCVYSEGWHVMYERCSALYSCNYFTVQYCIIMNCRHHYRTVLYVLVTLSYTVRTLDLDA
jgi:hypothetical protein